MELPFFKILISLFPDLLPVFFITDTAFLLEKIYLSLKSGRWMPPILPVPEKNLCCNEPLDELTCIIPPSPVNFLVYSIFDTSGYCQTYNLQNKRSLCPSVFSVQLHIGILSLIKAVLQFFHLLCWHFRNIPLNDLPLGCYSGTGFLPCHFLLKLYIQPLYLIFFVSGVPSTL